MVGNEADSGKTETLFELLDSLVAEGQKVLCSASFVQMLLLLEGECRQRGIPTHILTGQTKDRQQVVNTFQNDPNASVLPAQFAGGRHWLEPDYRQLCDPL